LTAICYALINSTAPFTLIEPEDDAAENTRFPEDIDQLNAWFVVPICILLIANESK
jgi:hypothetical protein